MKKTLKKEVVEEIKNSLNIINDSFKNGKKISYKERGTELYNSARYLIRHGNLRVQESALSLTAYPEHYEILLHKLNESVESMLRNSKIGD